MNHDFMTNVSHVLSDVSAIQARVGGLQARFGKPSKPGAFGVALDRAQAPAAPLPTGPIGTPAATGDTATPANPGAAGGLAAYGRSIAASSARHHIDPALVQAVIGAESGGNPRATSGVGAQGLMQLMPETARDLGVSNAYDPEQNIEGGTKYLAELTHKYGLSSGVAAYNAGPGAVERHGGIPPYPETRHYVEKVLSLYHQYKQ